MSAAAKTILIIDDDPAIRSTMQTLFELEGYDVVTAANGQEGVSALRNAHRPSLIFLDMMMPVMNGWQFLDVQRGDPKLALIPTVIISAYTESAKSVRPYRHFAKPLRLDALLDVAKECCG